MMNLDVRTRPSWCRWDRKLKKEWICKQMNVDKMNDFSCAWPEKQIDDGWRDTNEPGEKEKGSKGLSE